MSRCAATPATDEIRTLVALIGRLREHPDLSRKPAVLAGLAEAHAVWVSLLAETSAGAVAPATMPPKLH